jgi:hypothetical protein
VSEPEPQPEPTPEKTTEEPPKLEPIIENSSESTDSEGWQVSKEDPSQIPVKESYPEDSKQDSELVTIPTFSPNQSIDMLKEPLLGEDQSSGKKTESQKVTRRCGDNCIIC